MTGVNPLYFIVGMALLGLAPFFLMMVTSYVKIVVVTSLVRNALGVQQVPPAMVMNGLAIILSLFIMAPMMMSTMDIAEKLQISAEPSPKEVIGIVDKLSPPLRKFLSDNTEDGVLRAFMSTAKRIWPKEQHFQRQHADPRARVYHFRIDQGVSGGIPAVFAVYRHRPYHFQYPVGDGYDDGISHDHFPALQTPAFRDP